MKQITFFTALSVATIPSAASAYIFFSNPTSIVGGTGPWGGGTTANASTYSVEYQLTNNVSGVGTRYSGGSAGFNAAHPGWVGNNSSDYVGNKAWWDDGANAPFFANIRVSVNIRATNSTADAPDYSIVNFGPAGFYQPHITINEDSNLSDGITVINGFDYTFEWLGSSATTDPGGYTGRVDDGATDTVRPIVNVVETIGGTTGAGGTADIALTADDQYGNPIVITAADLGTTGTGPYQSAATGSLAGATLIDPTSGLGTNTAIWENFGSSGSDYDQLWFHGGGDVATDLISRWTLSIDAERTDSTASFASGTRFSFSHDGAGFAPDVIPEPSRVLLLLIAGAAIVLRRRKLLR